MTETQQAIYNYLSRFPHDAWVGPSEIGREVAGKDYYSSSSWASPICKRMVKDSMLERNEKGQYRVKRQW